MRRRSEPRSLHSRALIVAAVACASASACGPSQTAGSASAETLPATDRDPPPYMPAPADEAHTGEIVGITMSGGAEQARAVTLRFIEALREGDRETLGEQLAETLARSRPLSAPSRSREEVLGALTDPSHRRMAPAADAPVEQLIDVDGLDVLPLGQREDPSSLPEGLFPTDLDVIVPIRELGRAFFVTTLAWNQRGRLVIRPGADPKIVAL